MKMISLACPSCGANLELSDVAGRKQCFCQYCGQSIVLDEEQVNITGTVKVEGIDGADEILESGKNMLAIGDYLQAQNKFNEYVLKKPNDYNGWLGLFRARTRDFSVSDSNALFKTDIKKYYDNYVKTAPEEVIEEYLQEFDEYFHPEKKAARLQMEANKEIEAKADRLNELKKKKKELKQQARGGGMFSKFLK